MQTKIILSIFLLACANFAFAKQSPAKQEKLQTIEVFCQAWAKKLRSVEYQPCIDFDLQFNGYRSVQNRLLVHKEFVPQNNKRPKARVLAIGGVHGDEYSAISIGYLWMQTLQNNPELIDHHWLFLPLANPDGLFANPAVRQNANGVDLNRNFPTPDWDAAALDFWHQYYRSNPRRFPGKTPGSEPETQWQVDVIKAFRPDAIISIHAPYGLVDYDGPEFAKPNQVGRLQLRQLGTFPGSLGRYAGENLNIPVLTIELGSAGSLPSEQDILQIWQDMTDWIENKLKPTEADF